MEIVEHAFFRELGYSIVGGIEGADVHWPRVHADFDYHAPLYFEDEIELTLTILEKRSKTIKYRVSITKLHEDGVRSRVAVGNLVVCCTERIRGGGMRGVPIPAALASKLQVAPN